MVEHGEHLPNVIHRVHPPINYINLGGGWEDGTRWKEETELEDVVRGIYYVTLRYRNNLQQQIELMILPPGINLLNYGECKPR